MHQLASGATTLAPGGAAPRTLSPDGAPVDLLERPVVGAAGNGDGPARRISGLRDRFRRVLRAAGPESLALAAAAGVFSWQAGTPSPWRDEGATMVIAARPAGEILELVKHLDLVHAAYYFIVHALLVLDPSPSLGEAVPAVRAISVVAASVTALLLVRLGRRFGSTAVGLSAALALVAAPLASRYAQEARSYALVMLATTIAALLLLRAVQTPGPRNRRAWAWYAASLGLVALLNVIALLVVLAHAVYVAVLTPRAVRRRWLAATTAGLGVVSPFVVATFLQRGQVDWLYAPAAADLPRFWGAQYDSLAAVAGVLAVALLLVAVPDRFARLDPRRLLPAAVADRLGTTNTAALVLGLAWAVLPVVALWTISQAEPLYTWRYVVFTLPGTALVVGSLATTLRPAGLVVPLVVLALSGAHMQDVYRDPHLGHAEDMASVGEYVSAHAKKGDAVLWVPGGPGHMRTLQQLYPERYAGLIDVALDRTGAATATITGTEKEPEQIASALKKRKRVWLISVDGALGQQADAVDSEKVQLLLDGYRIKRVDIVHKFQVTLWEKAAAKKG